MPKKKEIEMQNVKSGVRFDWNWTQLSSTVGLAQSDVGVVENEETVERFKKAANKGIACAQHKLGDCLRKWHWC